MSTDPKWLSKEMAIALHDEQLVMFGGGEGLRDEGLLESALSRPINLFNYDAEAGICDLAASLGFGIIRNHPFIDGNKRAGLMAIRAFLYMNDYLFEPEQVDEVAVILAVAAGDIEEDELSRWITVNSSQK